MHEHFPRENECLAVLAHELRNPLASISNAVMAMQLTRLEDPGLREARAVIERQVRHLTRLVDDLLDVSRIARGGFTLRREPLEMAAVVTQAVELSRPLIDTHRHRLEVRLPDEPVRISGDPTRLAQIVTNLLNNAAKYTPPGGSIWLTVARDGGQVMLRVRDTGMGIPAEMLARVFNLFTQVEHTLDRSEGGLGIGLTLVRRLTEMHGGTVEALSDGPGRGSEFVVRLPLLAGNELRTTWDGRQALQPGRRDLRR